MKKKLFMISAAVCALAMGMTAQARNPYMDLWEHVPDGEPHIFNERVYVYGSHDVFEERMCGPNYVVWSAPVDDLTDWTYEGVSFDGGESGYLLAPDVCQGPDGRYYLYAFGDTDQGGAGKTFVAVSDEPQGPFEYVGSITLDGEDKMLFDPAVFVEDGKVWLFGGSSEIYQLDPNDMTTIIDGPYTVQEENEEGELVQIRNFLEGSSMRKVGDYYVFIYAAQHPLDEEWVSNVSYTANRYTGTLEYAYSKDITGPYTYGGVIVDNGGDKLGTGAAESMLKTNYNGNTHGSIIEINDQWYVFYHRQTTDTQTYRQAMCDPINVTVTDEGVQIEQAEVTSQGAELEGLNPLERYSAGIACYLTNSAYVNTDVEEGDELTPVVNIKNNAVVGVKYMNFEDGNYDLTLEVLPKGADGTIQVMLDDPSSEPVASFELTADMAQEYGELTQPCGEISGKHAVYFAFYGETQQELCEFGFFQFKTAE